MGVTCGPQGNNWLSVKPVGKKTNRAANGARIKVVTSGDHPLTVQRHVSSGSSFGANPREQHSGTTQVFHDGAVIQGIVVTELATDYHRQTWQPIVLPHPVSPGKDQR
jgi:hypothetical protein